MTPSLGSSSVVSSSQPLGAGTGLPRDFGQRRPAQGDRWPIPVAAAAIMGLSVALWFVLIQAGRMTLALVGH